MPKKSFPQVCSALAFLLLSTTASALTQITQNTLKLNAKDSANLMARMSTEAAAELYRGQTIRTKRFSTSDNAVRIDCAQAKYRGRPTPVACSITVDSTQSAQGVTYINRGVVPNSQIFRILAKKDVAAAMANIIIPYSTTETIPVVIQANTEARVARFLIQCPRDWVFDVVACEGHLITR